MLDEDPIELEKFKKYFNSVIKTKRSGEVPLNQGAMLANLLLNSNTKEYNLSQERVMNQTTTHRSPHVSNQSLNTSVTNFQHRRGNSTIDQYHDLNANPALLRNQKKVVYQ